MKISVVTDFHTKQTTRPLYERAFADPAPFVDYYYREKCRDNTMFVCYGEEGDILSMLHLNPYTLSVCGEEVPSYYVVAVATEEEQRRKGLMAAVLKESFRFLAGEEIPFCFLLPVNEAIYTPFGFETICPFLTREDPLSALPYEEVRKQYDVFCLRDALYRKRQEEEDALAAEGASEVLPDHPVMMAKVTDAARLSRLLGCLENSGERELLSALRGLRCFFREEV